MFNNSKTTKIKLLRNIVLILAVALIASFVLHDVIPHEHPSEIYGTGIQAIFHGSDRKYWYLLLLAFVWIAVDYIAKREFDIRLRKNFAYIRSPFYIFILRVRQFSCDFAQALGQIPSSIHGTAFARRGKIHINDIAGFLSFAKYVLGNYRGVFQYHLPLYLNGGSSALQSRKENLFKLFMHSYFIYVSH